MYPSAPVRSWRTGRTKANPCFTEVPADLGPDSLVLLPLTRMQAYHPAPDDGSREDLSPTLLHLLTEPYGLLYRVSLHTSKPSCPFNTCSGLTDRPYVCLWYCTVRLRLHGGRV